MEELRIAWEPATTVDPVVVSDQLRKYTDNTGTFAQFQNDTCLMLKPLENLEETIRGCMLEARRIPDFKVYQMEEGDFLVFFASALIMYVGKQEFSSRREEIISRRAELMFPSEHFHASLDGPTAPDDFLVGLYARGKLQRDAWMESNYQVVRPNPSIERTLPGKPVSASHVKR